jgi:hypothetical protein
MSKKTKPSLLGQRAGGYEDALKSSDSLVCFLYLLGRDHLPLGVVEKVVFESIAASTAGPVKFSNDFLAAYAKELRHRLGKVSDIQALRLARAALATAPF